MTDPYYRPKHRARTAMDDFMDWMDAASERNKVKFKAFEKPYCQEFSDVLDGFVIHAPECHRYQDMAVSGTGCVNLRHVRHWPPGLNEVI